MILTEKELENLEILKDQLCLPIYSTKVNRQTMISLKEKGLARIVNDRGREFLELTELGLNHQQVNAIETVDIWLTKDKPYKVIESAGLLYLIKGNDGEISWFNKDFFK